MFEVVWHGGIRSRLGGHTKGELLPSYDTTPLELSTNAARLTGLGAGNQPRDGKWRARGNSPDRDIRYAMAPSRWALMTGTGCAPNRQQRGG